jgi:hypothetical protein
MSRGNKATSKFLDDQAGCAHGSDDEDEDADDSEGSLAEFIADEGEDEDEDEQEDEDDSQSDSSASRSPPEKKKKGAAPAASAAVGKKRGRPVKAATTSPKTPIVKLPGDSTYPVRDFSLTVTKTKDDVGLDALESVASFIEVHCVKGGVATEVGQRAFQLHLQGMFRMKWPATKEFTQRLQKMIKFVLPEKGKLYKVLVKPFATNQVFSAMVGYITKDQGK